MEHVPAEEPVRPRPAATVVLLRDGAAGTGIEAYLQRRPLTMGFAAGVWVFPGGRVDDADRDPALDGSWVGPGATIWAERLGLGVDEARGMVVAACRETFEEAGLLLGDPPPRVDELAAARQALLGGSISFAAMLTELGVMLDTARLRYWAWWLTPEREPRRYDTRFFVAGLPPGAAATAHTHEAERERWLPPGEAITLGAALPMLPPTYCTLRDLADYRSVAEVLAAGEHRPVQQVMPWFEGEELVMPWSERFPAPAVLLGGQRHGDGQGPGRADR
jgi:8-oxo-dGTP pyrophosphatase MutT (NUDIX family)